MMLINGLTWRRDRAGILDTLMVTVGLGLGVWLLFLRGLVEYADMPLLTRLVTMAYPLADLMMLAAVIRFFTSTARRSATFWQLTGAMLLLGAAHIVWVWQQGHGIDSDLTAPAFVLSGLLIGGAVLHPSMAGFGSGEPPAPGQVTTRRAVLIGSACLLSPVLLIADGILGPARAGWLAASICCIIAFGLVIARMVGLVGTVQDQADQLEAMAYLDALTGIPNRRAWDTELQRRLTAARRHHGTLVIGLVDLDHFKRYNDEFGHPAGDQLLRGAALAWHGQLRSADLIARYGGEEFGLILHCRLSDADAIMERLGQVTPGGQHFSAGIAQWTGSESAEQLVARADSALYTAKREGRNRVAVSGDPHFTDLGFSVPRSASS
jgi:diguanylate cyclase (GGDEF)-like protein